MKNVTTHNQKVGDKCACADDLNFGEPQPDCSRCWGTGRVRNPDANVGPVFNFPKDKEDR